MTTSSHIYMYLHMYVTCMHMATFSAVTPMSRLISGPTLKPLDNRSRSSRFTRRFPKHRKPPWKRLSWVGNLTKL